MISQNDPCNCNHPPRFHHFIFEFVITLQKFCSYPSELLVKCNWYNYVKANKELFQFTIVLVATILASQV
jgi:hypothetical protein